MKNAAPFWMAGLAVVALLVWLVLSSDGGRARQLNASLIGTKGLELILPDNGIRMRASHAMLSPKAEDLSLAVIPLYDIDLYGQARVARTPQEEMAQSTQSEMDSEMLDYKLGDLPSLLVLPKWRNGFLRSDVAAVVTMNDPADMAQLLGQLSLPEKLLLRGGQAFVTEKVAMGDVAGQITVFAPQVFDRARLPKRCTERFGLAAGALLIDCAGDKRHVGAYYLSDPDLVNNHGLSLGENAGFAPKMLAALRRNAGPIYIDTNPDTLLTLEVSDDNYREYARGATEYARFFDHPLSALWAMAGVILALSIWRGARRFGPAVALEGDRLERSKEAAIEAKARLLRLSGHDGRMVAEFVSAQLADLAEAAFGSGTGSAGVERYFALLARRDAGLAADFQAQATVLVTRGANLPKAELYQRLECFRDLWERVTHAT